MNPNLAIVHSQEGILLLSQSLQAIWPDADLGATLNDFRNYLERIVPFSETTHMTSFWNKLEKTSETMADFFSLQEGKIPKTTIFGLISFGFSWGRLLVAFPEENRDRMKNNLDKYLKERQAWSQSEISLWVEDSETEFALTPLFHRLPEEFRENSYFTRIIRIPISSNDERLYEIGYHYQSCQWHQQIVERSSESRPDSGEDLPGQLNFHSVSRQKGFRVGDEVMFRFPVFLGGVLSLGDISVPSKDLSDGGLTRLNHFLRDISTELVPQAQRLTGNSYSFCSFWNGDGFSFEGLEDIAQIIDPKHFRSLMVLPFWESDKHTLAKIQASRRVSDPVFVDLEKNMGLILLRHCKEKDAWNAVWPRFQKQVEGFFDHPMTVEQFLKSV